MMTSEVQLHLDQATRVLHIVPALFDSEDGVIGGAERYALELARHMADETPTTLLSFGERERHETVGQLKIHVLGNPWYVRGLRTNPISARMLLGLKNVDTVHCHQQHKVSSSLAAAACRLTGRPVFVSDLGGGGWDISDYISTDRWYRGHLHISEYSRSVYGQVDKSWAHVIFGGVDTKKFSPDQSVKADGSILFVGRLLPHKGVDDLIRAVTPAMRLKIIGRAEHPDYFEVLKGLAREKRVEFVLDCDDEELVMAYRRAMCIVLPSVYKTIYGEETRVPELLGQTLLEGMSCGLPAICTDVASMPEIVNDGATGFIVPPNDPEALREKLVWLTNNRIQAKTMGEAARRRVVENFTWPMVVQRCLRIYADKSNAHSA